jgi:hypothetical protein
MVYVHREHQSQDRAPRYGSKRQLVKELSSFHGCSYYRYLAVLQEEVKNMFACASPQMPSHKEKIEIFIANKQSSVLFELQIVRHRTELA